MDENRLHEYVPKAVDHHCAHLKADPFLAQRVIRRAERKEPVIVRSKIRVGLIVAIVTMLLTATAVAAVILSGMEIIEQNAVPMAIGNDEGEVRANGNFSVEELQALIQVAAENGIVLGDDTSVMKALRRGEGYYEEETIMAICREAFGGLYSDWTLEQQYWFQEMMVAIGYSAENEMQLPGPDEMTSEQARQKARETVWEKYDANAPLTDLSKYRVREEYVCGLQADETIGEWIITFVAQDIRDATYWVSMGSRGEWVEHSGGAPDWSDYTENDLVRALREIYSTSGSWDGMEQEGWVILNEMLPGAKHSEYWTIEYDAFLKTTYVAPEAGDMDEKAMRQLLQKHLGDKQMDGLRSYVLIELDGRHVWRATATTLDANGETDQFYAFEIDAKTGEIISEVQAKYQRPSWAGYVPERVYQELETGNMTGEEAIDLAIKALYEEYGDDTIPFRDENIYRIECRTLYGGMGYSIQFHPLVLGYGRSSMDVYAETGEVKIWFIRDMGLNPDGLFKSYGDVYGSDMDWEQSTWVTFGEHLASLPEEPITFEGKLFRQTTYADDSQVKISKDEACDIAVLESGDKTNDIIRCMLIDAEPNPVWKIRLGSWPVNSLYEIDAMTGEVLDKEWYFIQDPTIDHDMKMFTLRAAFMPAYLAEYGVERVAMEYVVKSNIDRYGWEGHEQFLETDRYFVQVDGLTVTYIALTELGPAPESTAPLSYRVTVAEDGLSAEVTVLTDTAEMSELLKTAHKGTTAWAVGTYGVDRSKWPEGQRGGDEPNPGEMTREEAIAYAREHLIAEVGQEAYDALGEVCIEAEAYRFTNEGECVRWHIRFLSKASMEDDDPLLVGWRVTFSLRNNEHWTTPRVQDANDNSNG